MKVFLSWSGELSLKVALVFRDWLPSVIQVVVPYVSSEDIDKGARWSTDIAKELEESSFGILCVTSANVDEPWLNFEAGALSKTVDKARVCPFLFEVKRSEIKGPILQFQSSIFSKEDVKKLVLGLNSACETDYLDEVRLNGIFDVWWPKLEEQLESLKPEAVADRGPTPMPREEEGVNAMVEEILDLSRLQQKILRSPEVLIPPEYFENLMRRVRLNGTSLPTDVRRDLLVGLEKMDLLVHEYRLEEMIPSSDVLSVIRLLDDPIKYLLHSSDRAQPARFRHFGRETTD